MLYYFTIFYPDDKSDGYTVLFPEFPEAVTEGYSLPECMENAKEILKDTVEYYVKEGKELPTPFSIEETKIWEEKWVKETFPEADYIRPNRPSLYQLISAPDMDYRPVRIAVSLPKNILAMLDRKAKLAGTTRSGYIARMAAL